MVNEDLLLDFLLFSRLRGRRKAKKTLITMEQQSGPVEANHMSAWARPVCRGTSRWSLPCARVLGI